MIPMDRMEPQWWLQWWLHENMWFFFKLHKFSKYVETVRQCLGLYLNNNKTAKNMREKKMKIFWKIISPEKQTCAGASSYSVNSFFSNDDSIGSVEPQSELNFYMEKKNPKKNFKNSSHQLKQRRGLIFIYGKMVYLF